MPRSTQDATLRPRRQLTLPADICEALGLQVGDHVELALSGETLVIRPRKALALEALREIQQAFERTDLSEQELQEEGQRVREQLHATRCSQE